MFQIALQAVHFSDQARSWAPPIIRLLRVLGDPIPEGPVLFLNLYEIDEYVLGTQP